MAQASTQTTQTVATPVAGSTSRTAMLVQVGLAAFLGVFLVWGAGFAQFDVLHNAAHDTRHSNGFPCH